MDITTTTTTSNNTLNNNTLNNTSIKTQESEPETPTRIQPTKPKSFTNGLLKRHQPPLPPPEIYTYKECLKNHAATIGGHALDGCGEFMSSTTSTPTDPTSLKCAACGCHRNFHRREQQTQNNQPLLIEYQPHHRHHPQPPHPDSPTSPSPPPISSSYYPASAPHMLLALSAGLTPQTVAHHHHVTHSNARKRFRTKFTQQQKEKMLELAEKVEWKIQKKDEGRIEELCNEIGVDKGVVKVWMHNNKSTLGKRSSHNNNNNNNTTNIEENDCGDKNSKNEMKMEEQNHQLNHTNVVV